MALTLQRGASFVVGFGLSLLPAFAPFIALLFFLTRPWRFRRLDALAFAAALLFSLPLVVNDGVGSAALSLFQLVAAWLLFRSFTHLTQLRSNLFSSRLLGMGLLAGLALVVAVGVWQIEGVNVLARFWRAIVWDGSPALYAHTTLALGALIALLASQQRFRLASLSLSAFAILIAGSREAAIAWVVITLGLLLISPARSLRRRLTEWAVLAVMMVVTAGLGSLWGWGNFGFLLDLAPSAESTNLLQGTEVGNGDWWFEQGVEYSTATVTIADVQHTTFTIRKTSPEWWRRLQQFVPLQPDLPYTASVLMRRSDAGSQPGLQGWGELIGGGTMVVSGVLTGREWNAELSGPGRLLGSGVEDAGGGWQRAWISFEYVGNETLYWWMGLAPDQRDQLGSSADFAAFQLEQAESPSEYVPAPASAGLGLRTARIPYWQAAVAGIAERPLIGWGSMNFDDYFRNVWRDRSRFDVVPHHTHNLVLQVLFERGVVGALGFALFLAALLTTAIRRRDALFLLVAAGLLLANMFDYTLLYGGVLYPLAAVGGWRAGASRLEAHEGDEVGRRIFVRLLLAATDFAMAVLSLQFALKVAGLLGKLGALDSGGGFWHEVPTSILYALLLWPAMSWREGLYPSYGLTAPMELNKQVLGAGYAGLLLAVGTLLFNDALPIPRTVLVVTVAVSLVTLPIGRASMKRLLHALGLWGEPLVILGAGAAGKRVARALQDFPLDGLTPVAFFDDDPAKAGSEVEGIPVIGPLSEAGAWSEKQRVSRAIVAISRAPADIVSHFLRTQGRVLNKVQFIPDLPGLPVLGVQAGSLDNLLALEVRNELAVPANRLTKRIIDLVAVVLGGLLLSPFILLLAAAIRLDSRGPIFFAHRRVGHDGKYFKTWKFRTMVEGAERVLARHLASHPELQAEWQANQKLQNDPRITRVGRFLRKTSLDELPQLFNVLKGDMSLVGPRPIVEAEIEKYDGVYDLYKMVRPGITGYWQVSGRSNTDYAQRVELDSFYVRNWSVWLDVVILIRTVRVVLRGEGAW